MGPIDILIAQAFLRWNTVFFSKEENQALGIDEVLWQQGLRH